MFSIRMFLILLVAAVFNTIPFYSTISDISPACAETLEQQADFLKKISSLSPLNKLRPRTFATTLNLPYLTEGLLAYERKLSYFDYERSGPRSLGFGISSQQFSLYHEQLKTEISVIYFREFIAEIQTTITIENVSTEQLEMLRKNYKPFFDNATSAGTFVHAIRDEKVYAELDRQLAKQLGEIPTLDIPVEFKEAYSILRSPHANLEFGQTCYYAAVPPPGRREIDQLEAAKRFDLVRAVAKGPNPVGRVYAASVLAKDALNGAENAKLINEIAGLNINISSCSGCTSSASTAQILLDLPASTGAQQTTDFSKNITDKRVEDLFESLINPEIETPFRAARELLESSDKVYLAHLPYLLEKANSSDTFVRTTALQILSSYETTDSRVLSTFSKALLDDFRSAWLNAVIGIARQKKVSKELVSAVQQALMNKSNDDKERAYVIILKLKSNPFEDSVIDYYQKTDPAYPESIELLWQQFGTNIRVFPIIVRAATHKNAYVRNAALQGVIALYLQRETEITPLLEQALYDDYYYNIKLAADGFEAIGHGTPKVIDRLNWLRNNYYENGTFGDDVRHSAGMAAMALEQQAWEERSLDLWASGAEVELDSSGNWRRKH